MALRDPSQITRWRARLLRWYDRHRRDLPWRRTRDPYRIWVSEVMLQQTRVAAVVERYREFLRRFPDVRSLARAREHSVLAAWSGLGYYRRARALHAAARRVVREFGGELPHSAEGLRALPGIGRYTAAAIASIAFGERCAVVDGNVERVLRRWMGWDARRPQSKVWALAEELVSPRRPGDFNQALMELGATVCLPATPQCGRCPLATGCASRGRVEPRQGTPRQKAELAYVLRRRGQAVLLVRRPAQESVMPGMWELPPANGGGRELFRLRHAIMNTDYLVRVLEQDEVPASGGRWVSPRAARALALTGVARKVLRRAGSLPG